MGETIQITRVKNGFVVSSMPDLSGATTVVEEEYSAEEAQEAAVPISPYLRSVQRLLHEIGRRCFEDIEAQDGILLRVAYVDRDGNEL